MLKKRKNIEAKPKRIFDTTVAIIISAVIATVFCYTVKNIDFCSQAIDTGLTYNSNEYFIQTLVDADTFPDTTHDTASAESESPLDTEGAESAPDTTNKNTDMDSAPAFDNNEEKLWFFLLERIENEYGVAALMGNLYAESKLVSNNLQNSYEAILGYTDETYTLAVDDGTYTRFANDSAAYGLAQWKHWSRKQGLFEYANSVNKSIGDFDMQMEYLYKELEANYAPTLNVLKSANNVFEASTFVLIYYESPTDCSAVVQAERAAYGEKYYNTYCNS